METISDGARRLGDPGLPAERRKKEGAVNGAPRPRGLRWRSGTRPKVIGPVAIDQNSLCQSCHLQSDLRLPWSAGFENADYRRSARSKKLAITGIASLSEVFGIYPGSFYQVRAEVLGALQ